MRVVRKTWEHVDQFRDHIKVWHNTYVGDVKTVDGLREAHAAFHADRDPLWYSPHIHHESED